jgi:2-polyprenyl-3-methyl-5-hydroxy-6-metoxy-1,4-benzoquinol methylase
MMDAKTILEKKREFIAWHGDWELHNIHLGQGVFTIGDRLTVQEVRLRSIVQMVADLMRKRIEELRVLDLACAEGMNAIEFARRGSQTLGIEGRDSTIKRANFVKELLGLTNLEFVQDDVRNLRVEKYGRFDVVLSLGIILMFLMYFILWNRCTMYAKAC